MGSLLYEKPLRMHEKMAAEIGGNAMKCKDLEVKVPNNDGSRKWWEFNRVLSSNLNTESSTDGTPTHSIEQTHSSMPDVWLKLMVIPLPWLNPVRENGGGVYPLL